MNRNEEAIAEQEVRLVPEIFTLGFLIESGQVNSPHTAQALATARKYRQDFPESFQARDLRQSVDHALQYAK
jgi:hypothetical protein